MTRRLAGLLLLAASACNVSAPDPVAGPAGPSAATPAFTGMVAVEDPAVHNLIHVSERIWSGAAPEDEATFAALAARGVKTMVNVDGARPAIELAAKYGMRYVHIPFGYDGVDENAAMQIVRLIEETDEPIYFHCHHGVHRGPAAAAIALQVETGCSAEDSGELLRLAKTDPKYAGLWRDVLAFAVPPAGVPRPRLHEVAPVGDLVAAMAKMDREWDRIKLLQKNAWQVPAEHPDLAPAKEARILAETYAALDAVLAAEQAGDADFMAFLAEGQRASRALRDALAAGDADAAAQGFAAVKQSCADCHRPYRDAASDAKE